ncbi:hypothetical protein M413DRAFT_25683 [Hebeloma cylindrosporum]|uniref:Uncharacterized protein n=1 Tax=Hebeloma cylindrosporum TaxID=76867 RepID=A0A0C3CKE0_HEBCY|nr:hypothetical protein M413DRAFT_25683 [Hebeloma cylindrosporum h7]
MRLPYDVLWYMFGFILSDDVSRSPTTISHLCRSWRLAALQTPFLWSHITMVLGHDMNQKNELAQSRFERADNHPIDLTIRARRHFSDAEKSQLILPNAHRLRRLTIESFLGQFSLPLLWDAFPRRMPLLDEFYGLSMPETRVHMIRKPAARFSDSEEFSSLIPFGLKDLNPHRLSFVTCDVYCPKNLTTIVLAPTGLFLQPTLSDIHRILSGTASTLQHFEYEGPTPYLCSDTKYKPIEFPDLYSISIGYSDDVVPFLCFFKAPGLKRLDLLSFKHSPTTPIIPRTYGQQIPTNPKKLLRVISQWKSLHHLGLFAIGELPANATLQYIQCLDSLEYLVLYHAHSFAKVLCSQGSNKSSILLPNLKNLLYTAAGYESQLLSFLKARNSHNLGPLECLVVDIDPKFLDARAGRLSVEDLDVLRTGSRFLKLFTCQSYVSVEPQQWFWGETSV